MECLPASSGSSRNGPLPSPSSPRKLNDHIYELYKPTEEPSMDILFFHGLQFRGSTEAYLSTWTCGDSSGQIWPSTWLVEEFPKANVFSVSYDACMRRTPEQGRFDLYSVAENLIQAIYWANIGQVPGRPVILVGHSFGGLVIKSLYVKADHTHGLGPSESDLTQKIKRFLQNMRGVFFYGTPHRGSSLFDKAASFLGGPLLPYVKLLSTESARLESEFTSVCRKYGISRCIGSVGESLPTSWGLFQGGLVVPEASARYGPDFCTAKANHITLCQPISKTSTSFQCLKTYLHSIQPKVEARQLEASFGNMQPIRKPLFGLDLAVRTVQGMLQENEKLGLVGMGGVGKTTLAMAVFNKLGPTFEYTCFVPVMKLISSESVEEEVWNRLHCHGKKVVDSYRRDSWSTLRGKRLLLVLDDISDNSNRDLDLLSHIADGIGASESRFIVTSRDGDQVNVMDEIYRVSFLDDTNAKQLFMHCAFPRMLVPPVGLESHVEAIVKKCGGLPLTLEVIGNYLRRKPNVKVWTQTLEDLDKANAITIAEHRLWAQLRLSYESLEEIEQQMFLDVTAFFVGTTWTLREAKVVWNVTYGSEDRRWQTLLDMSLVYDVKDNEDIKVHEQLLSLGRKIASESKKCRIWNETEALELLQSTDESDDRENEDIKVHGQLLRLGRKIASVSKKCRIWKKTEALKLLQSTDESDDRQFHALRFEDLGVLDIRSAPRRLKTVRYLDLDKLSIFIGGVQKNKPFPTHHLVLLGCKADEFDYLFSHFTLGGLLVLRLSCPTWLKARKFYMPGCIGQLSALKILTMLDCHILHSLSDEIGCLSHLECLRLLNCGSLRELPESFGALLNLKDLELIGCTNLKTLPESFGQLWALKYLKLQGSLYMVTLPDSFGHLRELRRLEFVRCAQLHILPDSFGHLSTLQHLEFHSCAKLNDLPEFFGQLGKLQHLVIDDCPEMKKLPNSLVDLKDLRCLSIQYIGLRSIPDFIETLPSLETIELGFLPWLTKFPAWLGEITLVSPGMSVRRIFHVRQGRFTLALAEEQNVAAGNWIRALLVKEEVKKDYDEAQAALEIWGHVNLRDLFSAGSNDRICLLWKNGNLKRLTKDLHGSLKDLDAAVETCIDIQGMTSVQEHLEYICRLERGYVRSLLNDMEGAREDAEVAFKYQSSITDLLSFERVDFPNWCDIGAWEIPIPAMYQLAISYCNLTFLGMREYKDNVTLMRRVHSQAMKKVKRSDFTGALVRFDTVDTVDVSFLGFRAQAFILQERGILKRLTGDLNGAVDDLNSAVELISARQFEGGDFRFTSGYESLKQRGFAKYLAGDLDGARDDATTAVRKFNAAPKCRMEMWEKHRGLPVGYVRPSSWQQGWLEREVVPGQVEPREGWEVAEDEVEVAEDEIDGAEGRLSYLFLRVDKLTKENGEVEERVFGYGQRLGEQSLKFVGFNLKFVGFNLKF